MKARLVKTAGNMEEMFVIGVASSCGGIYGPAVAFGRDENGDVNAGFVIDINEIKRMVLEYEALEDKPGE